MDQTDWQKCRFPVMAKPDVLLGGWLGDRAGAQVFRRKRNGKWEYSQDEETCDTWAEAQLS